VSETVEPGKLPDSTPILVALPTLIACMSWPSSSSPICGELEDLRLEFQLSSKTPRARLDIRRKQLVRRFQAAAYRRASRIGLRLVHPCLCTVHSAHDMGPPSYSSEYQPASTVYSTTSYMTRSHFQSGSILNFNLKYHKTPKRLLCPAYAFIECLIFSPGKSSSFLL
jgi:hypothetical protein